MTPYGRFTRLVSDPDDTGESLPAPCMSVCTLDVSDCVCGDVSPMTMQVRIR